MTGMVAGSSFFDDDPSIWGWIKTIQNRLLSILIGWTSIYQLFWGSLGARVLTNSHISQRIPPLAFKYWKPPESSKITGFDFPSRTSDDQVMKTVKNHQGYKKAMWKAVSRNLVFLPSRWVTLVDSGNNMSSFVWSHACKLHQIVVFRTRTLQFVRNCPGIVASCCATSCLHTCLHNHHTPILWYTWDIHPGRQRDRLSLHFLLPAFALAVQTRADTQTCIHQRNVPPQT